MTETTGGLKCQFCGHVHTSAREVIVDARASSGVRCVNCKAAVAFGDLTLDLGLMDPRPPARFAEFLGGLSSTREVLVAAVPPECMAGRYVAIRGEGGVAIVDKRGGEEWHLSNLEALNLLLALAREVQIPPVLAKLATRIAL